MKQVLSGPDKGKVGIVKGVHRFDNTLVVKGVRKKKHIHYER